jgi:nitrate/nitrite transporter NarK
MINKPRKEGRSKGVIHGLGNSGRHLNFLFCGWTIPLFCIALWYTLAMVIVGCWCVILLDEWIFCMLLNTDVVMVDPLLLVMQPNLVISSTTALLLLYDDWTWMFFSVIHVVLDVNSRIYFILCLIFLHHALA